MHKATSCTAPRLALADFRRCAAEAKLLPSFSVAACRMESRSFGVSLQNSMMILSSRLGFPKERMLSIALLSMELVCAMQRSLTTEVALARDGTTPGAEGSERVAASFVSVAPALAT